MKLHLEFRLKLTDFIVDPTLLLLNFLLFELFGEQGFERRLFRTIDLSVHLAEAAAYDQQANNRQEPHTWTGPIHSRRLLASRMPGNFPRLIPPHHESGSRIVFVAAP